MEIQMGCAVFVPSILPAACGLLRSALLLTNVDGERGYPVCAGSLKSYSALHCKAPDYSVVTN
ncbi:MAG: hypothetical protein Aurels2KO_32080 [Aureliella sp.]